MELKLDRKTQCLFAQIAATINSVTIAKFFHFIYKILFIFLLAISKIEEELLRLILNYLAMVKTNECKLHTCIILFGYKKLHIYQ